MYKYIYINSATFIVKLEFVFVVNAVVCCLLLKSKLLVGCIESQTKLLWELESERQSVAAESDMAHPGRLHGPACGASRVLPVGGGAPALRVSCRPHSPALVAATAGAAADAPAGGEPVVRAPPTLPNPNPNPSPALMAATAGAAAAAPAGGEPVVRAPHPQHCNPQFGGCLNATAGAQLGSLFSWS